MYKIYWQQIFPFLQLPYRFPLLTVQFYFEALSFLSWLQSLESRVREVESERRHLVCKARSSNTLRNPRYRQLSLIDSFQRMDYKRSLANATHGKYQLVTADAHLPQHAPQRRYAACRALGLVVQTAIKALMLG